MTDYYSIATMWQTGYSVGLPAAVLLPGYYLPIPWHAGTTCSHGVDCAGTVIFGFIEFCAGRRSRERDRAISPYKLVPGHLVSSVPMPDCKSRLNKGSIGFFPSCEFTIRVLPETA
jgi:hypothetical protein